MSQAGNDNAVLHIEDITNAGAAERLVDIADKTFGKLDAVVNNAAAILSSNIETTDTVSLKKYCASTWLRRLRADQAALPHLSKQKGVYLISVR
jgi:NADP-dependent 3-hydroxy acid dehydrogenase YdfG